MSKRPNTPARVVVKVGSGLLAGWDTRLDRGIARSLVTQLATLSKAGSSVVLVSSGAVALGCERLGWDHRPTDIPSIQAAAAVGQGDLVTLYRSAFSALDIATAQVLLTHADLADRRRFLNARHTLNRLLELGVLPILNENDTVAVDELKFGDNDNLAAVVANLVGAELLVILTDQDGLFDKDPRQHDDASIIAEVHPGDELPHGARGEAATSLSIGGMATKVEAARRATAAGIPCRLANGTRAGVLEAIMNDEVVGTRFHPAPEALGSRKAWIAGLRPLGTLRVDQGAANALKTSGRSLLPAGIVAAEGSFENGDPVAIIDQAGDEFARGLSAYGHDEISRIAGAQTSKILSILGYDLGAAVVHRDDLALL